MDYLTRWRMLLAANRLINSGDAISVISLSLGYESESAFSTAFRRVMRSSPRQYAGRRTSNRSQSIADADEKVIERELVID
jgi:AraC-like DNA-binding protein